MISVLNFVIYHLECSLGISYFGVSYLHQGCHVELHSFVLIRGLKRRKPSKILMDPNQLVALNQSQWNLLQIQTRPRIPNCFLSSTTLSPVGLGDLFTTRHSASGEKAEYLRKYFNIVLHSEGCPLKVQFFVIPCFKLLNFCNVVVRVYINLLSVKL